MLSTTTTRRNTSAAENNTSLPDTPQKKKRASRLEQLTKKVYIELGDLAMKAAAVITGSLAGKKARQTHHRSRDWCSEDNY
jgi:hypothetical protein